MSHNLCVRLVKSGEGKVGPGEGNVGPGEGNVGSGRGLVHRHFCRS